MHELHGLTFATGEAQHSRGLDTVIPCFFIVSCSYNIDGSALGTEYRSQQQSTNKLVPRFAEEVQVHNMRCRPPVMIFTAILSLHLTRQVRFTCNEGNITSPCCTLCVVSS